MTQTGTHWDTNSSRCEPGDVVVFGAKPTGLFGLAPKDIQGLSQHVSHRGLRGLVYDKDETWIYLIVGDKQLRVLADTADLVVVTTFEEALAAGANDSPPKRRVWPGLAASDIVGCQPMTAPVKEKFWVEKCH